MVAIGEGLKISATAIRRDLTSTWPNLPDPTRAEKKDNTLAFRVGGSEVILGVMPAPIPWSDLQGPCGYSWLWPEATMQLRRHISHVVVTVSDDSEPVQRARLLTMATASVLRTCQAAVGVYWSAAKLVVPSSLFREFAVETLPDGCPLYAWVDFRVTENEDGTSSGFTTGMSALGHMELETTNAVESPGDLRDRFYGLAGYLLDNGPCVCDGDTIGEDNYERIRIVYSQSAFGNPNNVMRLDYGTRGRTPLTRKKPWWSRLASRTSSLRVRSLRRR
jgi:hypothetical protein